VKSESADETAQYITSENGEAIGLAADVRNRAEVQAALEATVERWGMMHYLVNNAGLVTMDSLADLTDEHWNLVLDVNLKGQFIVTQLAAPLLSRAAPSAIVNLSTVEADVVASFDRKPQPHYNASKGGVKMFTKAAAVELSAQGTRVNCVAPGPVQTAFIPGSNPARADLPPPAADRLLIQRWGQPEDIAAAVSFLLSDDAAYITGTQLVVDGGWLAR
jgi:glucose 1-dehydrogenase/3-oxoacyl-[acyl-carrier protein] reductase